MKIVELIGLAGAGKSTITGHLPKYSSQISVEEPPYFRKLRDIPFFAVNALLTLPTVASLFIRKGGDRGLRRDEIVWIVLLEGWHRRLRRQAAIEGKVIVLDQGPVFLLMLLHLFGPASIKWPNARNWWLRMAKQWAGLLDAAIWLDAPDEILVRRIRGREKWHGVKEKTTGEAIEYMGQYRVAFEEVLFILAASREDFKVMRINTGIESLQQSVKRVLNMLNLRNGGSAR